MGDPPKNTDRPVEQDFAVSTGGIKDAEDQLILSGKWNVEKFEAFKKKVLEEEKWVSLVSDPKDMEPYYHSPHGDTGKDRDNGVIGGTYADFTDPDPETTQKTIDSQHGLLRAVGDAYEGIGHYIAMLNNAAQMYALADENSYVPEDSTV